MKHLFLCSLPLHLLAAYGIFTGVVAWPWFFVMWTILGLGSEAGIHRLFSHSAYRTSKFWKNFLIIAGSLSGQGPILYWAALHRGVHHPRSDEAEDMHSPQNHKWYNVWRSYMWWTIKPPYDVPIKYAGPLLRDRFQVWFAKRYYVVQAFVLLALYLIGAEYVTAYSMAAVAVLHVNLILNTVCHLDSCGVQRWPTRDHSRDVWWWVIPSFGLAYHNFHHYKPQEVLYGPFDIAGWFIKAIKK